MLTTRSPLFTLAMRGVRGVAALPGLAKRDWPASPVYMYNTSMRIQNGHCIPFFFMVSFTIRS